MLASIGIFPETKGGGIEEHTNQRFELTPMASLLLSETKDSVRNFALLFGLAAAEKSKVIYCLDCTGEFYDFEGECQLCKRGGLV